jgi:hypothetical protein
MRIRLPLALTLAPLALALPAWAAAQDATHHAAQERVDSLEAAFPVEPRAAAVPFGPGERLVYHVKVGIFGAGEGSLEVVGVDTVRGHRSYHVRMQIDGGLMGLSVHDKYDSWFDVRTLTSWRFIQDINDPGYSSFRHYEMYPERRSWEREDNDEFGPLGSPLPLDDISFIYYIRTLPLEVGKTYTLPRYFKEDGNPVIVKVLRKDTRETDAGKFNTIVVKPLIKTKGLFGQGGDAEIHFTDDERRIVVYMKSNIPKFPGSLTLHLEKIEEGVPLNPGARAEALERWQERDTKGGSGS